MLSKFKQQLSEFLGLSYDEIEKCLLGPFKSKFYTHKNQPHDFVILRPSHGIEFNDLVIQSVDWILNIDKILLTELGVIIFLNKVNTFRSVLRIASSASWTFENIQNHYNWTIKQENSDTTLTSFRINRTVIAIKNILKKFGNSDGNDASNLFITYKSNTTIPDGHTLLLCSVVRGKDCRKSMSTINELYEQLRLADDRNDFTFDKFKDILTFNMLKVKHTTAVTATCPPSDDFYDVRFILYNYARIAAILEQFEERVATCGYSPLPPIDECDLSVLKRQEEWNLLVKYILPYPEVIMSVVKELPEGKIAIHKLCIFLYSMVCEFSSYYKRERILWENKEFYLPLMHARLHLVISIRQVIYDALTLLDITPLKSM